MASLPPEPVSLTGGCFCSAVRYTIAVPALASRDFFPHPVATHHGASNDARLPLVTLDHCQDCRRATGTVVQSWFICPRRWVRFALQPRDDDREPSYADPFSPTEAVDCPADDVVAPSADLLRRSYLACYNSSPDVGRCFCSRCGTTLTYAFTGPLNSKTPPLVDLALGTLDAECIVGGTTV
jgi:hypothetical protein